ncbi:MAG TPA: ProQ/FinO family protein [Candidatus Competibacteraceae bacterium]|nr:ProQ/FinO family protein [Candidatus Competibacteraceae bacterium]
MSRCRPPTELLSIMTAAFPQTFFTDPAQVQPLKVGIDQDLLAALPEGIKLKEVKGFLHGYVNRAAYLKALLHGQGRIDLTGAVVDGEIPAEIRERARERFLELDAARRNAKFGKPTKTRPADKPGQSRPAAPAPQIDHEELFAMAIDAKLEITLKFSTLPNARPAGSGKMAFALKTPDGQFVTVVVNNKAWGKLTKAAEEWPQWVAALSGSMGERNERGFTLAGPGLQVFEKKPKVPADTTEVAASAPPPASPPPAEPAAPPPPAPVIVTTKAGAATVTVTKRAPLSLKR